MSLTLADARVISAFGQGRACREKGGYLSDNPHIYKSESWQAWREGFVMVERDRARG